MTGAEKTVRASEQALQQAEQQLAELDRAIEGEREKAASIEAEIQRKHEGGQPVSSDDRKRRREALAEVEDLEHERETIEALIERRKAEIRQAHVDLAAARAAELEEEADLLGGELWETLAQMEDQWERLRAVDAAHDREKTTLRYGGHPGPNPAGILQRVGLENHKARVADLLSNLRADLAQRASV